MTAEDEPVVRFSVPDDEAHRLVRDTLVGAPVATWSAWEHWPKQTRKVYTRPRANVAGMELTLIALMDALRLDYRQTSQDVDWDGWFDYMIWLDPLARGAYRIDTCLRSHRGDGSINYGRLVLRLAHDEYAVWIDQ